METAFQRKLRIRVTWTKSFLQEKILNNECFFDKRSSHLPCGPFEMGFSDSTFSEPTPPPLIRQYVIPF